MKYDLIFYISKKTSYCERAARRALGKIDAEPHRIVGATTPTELGAEVSHSLRICPMAVIIGGLGSDYDDNLATVLSRVFSNSSLTLENMRKLKSADGDEGYIIRYRSQILLALPDSPDAVEELCTDELLSFIKDKLDPEYDPEDEYETEPDHELDHAPKPEEAEDDTEQTDDTDTADTEEAPAGQDEPTEHERSEESSVELPE